MTAPYYQDDAVTLWHGEAFEVMASIRPGSVHLFAADPPYFRKVDAAWDDQWGADVSRFIAWIGEVIAAAVPLVADRGTFAMFASPDYAAGVEMEFRARTTVLNHIVWDKPIGRLGKACAADLRRFFPESERIIIAEQAKGPDRDLFRFVDHVNHAVSREVYADIRAELCALRDAAGLTNRDIDAALGTSGMAGHYFGASQWTLPNREAWAVIANLMRGAGIEPPEFDALRSEFDALRSEFDGRRREFEKKLLGDVWNFPTPRGLERTAHPTQKPLGLMDHIIGTLSREDDLVLDPFAGSGTTLVAAKAIGRRAVGIELDERYCEIAAKRLSQGVFDFGEAS